MKPSGTQRRLARFRNREEANSAGGWPRGKVPGERSSPAQRSHYERVEDLPESNRVAFVVVRGELGKIPPARLGVSASREWSGALDLAARARGTGARISG